MGGTGSARRNGAQRQWGDDGVGPCEELTPALLKRFTRERYAEIKKSQLTEMLTQRWQQLERDGTSQIQQLGVQADLPGRAHP